MLQSVTEYAASQDISRQAAYDRLKRIGIKPKSGRIDSDEVGIKWAQMRDGLQQQRGGKALQAEVEPPLTPAPSKYEDDEPDYSLSEAQRRLTWIKAEREKLELEKSRGEILPVEAVRINVAAMIAATKSRFMTVADELCDRLASESSPIRCREMVDHKINEALLMLAEWPVGA